MHSSATVNVWDFGWQFKCKSQTRILIPSLLFNRCPFLAALLSNPNTSFCSPLATASGLKFCSRYRLAALPLALASSRFSTTWRINLFKCERLGWAQRVELK